ncbi:hypothetical protein CC117_14830 [Parafrankia colletiae]|uniref:Uncharacterized protein n=1 Tax=Parafrankia colletiae TaxID=573497 RepID=A0A1S1R0R6_9ACTN|nr:hypothetical protein [Parafrankia colletiae]MCK9898697.1 hypothetical protein [Frankia sp. Cpl3]OHV39476.1 hypothetical protein CC117_14830 [Parafrankia colletiae]
MCARHLPAPDDDLFQAHPHLFARPSPGQASPADPAPLHAAARHTADAALARLRSTAAALSATLLDLDAAAEQVLGDGTGLRGRTAERAALARTGMNWLWERHRALSALLTRAEELRGTAPRPGARQAARLDRLLNGPWPGLGAPPPTGLGAVTPLAAPADVDEVARAIGAELAAVTRARAEHHHLLGEAARAVSEAVATCARLGVPDLPELAAAQADLRAAFAGVTANPLEITPADLRPAQTSAAQVAELVAALRDTFDALEERLAAAEDLLGRVVATAATGEHAARTVVERLTGDRSGLVRLDDGWFDDPLRGLRPWLDRLRAAGAAGEWRLVAHGLRAWTRVAEATLAAAGETVATNQAPLRRRNELRGLLDALRAKAGQRGQIESAALGDLYDRAATALSTTPVDLDAAEALVAAFSAALGVLPAPPPEGAAPAGGPARQASPSDVPSKEDSP